MTWQDYQLFFLHTKCAPIALRGEVVAYDPVILDLLS